MGIKLGQAPLPHWYHLICLLALKVIHVMFLLTSSWFVRERGVHFSSLPHLEMLCLLLSGSSHLTWPAVCNGLVYLSGIPLSSSSCLCLSYPISCVFPSALFTLPVSCLLPHPPLVFPHTIYHLASSREECGGHWWLRGICVGSLVCWRGGNSSNHCYSASSDRMMDYHAGERFQRAEEQPHSATRPWQPTLPQITECKLCMSLWVTCCLILHK